MISVWWLIPAIMVGALIGVFFIALSSYNDDPSEKKKWWEDD